ncbi:hypothetical protein Tco_1071602 [Tanacetum coccineum]
MRRGKGAHEAKASVTPKKTTKPKKKQPKRKLLIQPPSVPVKNIVESSKKLKGVELLPDAAQLEIDAQKAIKAKEDFSINLVAQVKELELHQRFQMSQKTKVKLEMILMIGALLMMRNIYSMSDSQNAHIPSTFQQTLIIRKNIQTTDR